MFWRRTHPQIITDKEKIRNLLRRGVAEVIEAVKTTDLLQSGRPLRIKLGIDPTSPNIHIGRAVVLWKLRAFQELGHQVIFIVGDFTGLIGDTSDKESERPMLSEDTITENIKEYFKQAGRILDIDKVEKHYNSKWLSKLTYKEIGEQANAFSVADFIGRENIDRRLKAGARVSLREVLYPLMQGFDSVEVKADIEIGGTDQRFNLLSGRTMQIHYKQKPQQILMTELLPGLDGRKMSSSWGNTINITDSPTEMFGKAMSIKDELVSEFLLLTTALPEEKIKEIEENVASGSLHPKEAKLILARELTALYHGKELAKKAEEQFEKTFSKKEAPEEIMETTILEGELLADLLVRSKIVESKSDFSRLIQQGAIEVMPNEVIKDPKELAKKNLTYKIGKHRFLKTK